MKHRVRSDESTQDVTRQGHDHADPTTAEAPEDRDHLADTHRSTRDTAPADRRDDARDTFGGINWGSAFFGWLVAVALTVLLISIVGAIATAIGSEARISQDEAERQAGTIGITAAVVLAVVLAIAYFSGGYVAGRMSRFDGARQGLAVWVIGLVVTLVALATGAAFGAQYNILDRVDLPRIPLSTDELSTGGLVTAVAVVAISLLAALVGGGTGRRYHARVDRAVRV